MSRIFPLSRGLRVPFRSDFTVGSLFSEERISTLQKLSGSSLRSKASVQNPTQYSVLVPFVSDSHGQVSLLYTKRSSGLRSHSGEICFPGGKVDEEDENSFIKAALRETREEIGLDPESVEIISTLRPTSNRKGTGLVTPVVGLVRNLKETFINAAEVERLILVPLSQLCDPSNIGYTQFKYKEKVSYSLPVFGIHSEDRIWGMTALMTHQVLKALLPKDQYQHAVRYLPKIN